ncbi:MAG TPA: NlpC/P60 family protein [Coriobacteriia bacterium]|nr:NlpC/P60 family protein [Coriobacteriia bacterium]
MARRSIARLTKRAGATALAVALLATSSAYADTSSLTTSPSTPRTTLKEPATSTTTTKKSPTIKAPSTSTTREPASTNSEIDVNVDTTTKKFRKELADRQKRLDEFQDQLYTLDRELELATEEYNEAREKLAKVKANVQVAAGDLDKAQTAYSIQTDILGDRASSIYKDGSLNIVELLLGADSVGDFITRVKFLNTIGIRDADIAASLKGQKQLLEQRVGQLEGAEAAAESLEFELKARQIEIMLRIQERQDMMTDAQQDLLEVLDKEAARRQSDEQQLFAEIISGATSKGIVAKAGTPVETALAYHGVPYLWGGETTRGFDCSGLVLYVYAQHGVALPHYSGSQFQLGTKVSATALIPGDVVFFGSPIHHVGIYMGGGYYIHAPRTGDFVKISKLSDRSDFAGARRYDWQLRTGEPKNAVKSTTDALKGYSNSR